MQQQLLLLKAGQEKPFLGMKEKKGLKKKGGKIPAVTALLTQKKAAAVFLQISAVSEF